MIWLDVLDLPLMVYLDVSYAIQGTPQTAREPAYAYAAGGVRRAWSTGVGPGAPIR